MALTRGPEAASSPWERRLDASRPQSRNSLSWKEHCGEVVRHRGWAEGLERKGKGGEREDDQD